MSETCSSAHSAGAAIAGAASAGAAIAKAASAGADQWHSLRSCVCEPEPGGGVRFRYRRPANPKPNPAVACASAPPVCESEAEPEPGGGVRFRTTGLQTQSRTRRWRAFLHRRSPNPKPTSCDGGAASLGGDLCKSALRVSGCSLAERQAKLLLTSTHWPWPSGSAGAASRGRPPRIPAASTVQPAPSRRCSLGGALVEDLIVVKYIHS
jgi:hypothetical protein